MLTVIIPYFILSALKRVNAVVIVMILINDPYAEIRVPDIVKDLNVAKDLNFVKGLNVVKDLNLHSI